MSNRYLQTSFGARALALLAAPDAAFAGRQYVATKPLRSKPHTASNPVQALRGKPPGILEMLR